MIFKLVQRVSFDLVWLIGGLGPILQTLQGGLKHLNQHGHTGLEMYYVIDGQNPAIMLHSSDSKQKSKARNKVPLGWFASGSYSEIPKYIHVTWHCCDLKAFEIIRTEVRLLHNSWITAEKKKNTVLYLQRNLRCNFFWSIMSATKSGICCRGSIRSI